MALRKVEIATDAIGSNIIQQTYLNWADASINLDDLNLPTGGNLYFRITSPEGIASTWYGPTNQIPAPPAPYVIGQDAIVSDNVINTITLNYPAGEVGDLLIAKYLGWPLDLQNSLTVPAGWDITHSLLDSNETLHVVAKIADTTSSGQLSVDFGYSGGRAAGIIYRIRNHGCSSTSDIIANIAKNGDSSPALTDVPTGSLVLIGGFSWWWNGEPGAHYFLNTLPPVGFADVVRANDGGTGYSIWASGVFYPAGDIGPFQWSDAAVGHWSSVAIPANTEAQFYTDFSEYTLGAAPADWTVRSGTPTTFEVRDSVVEPGSNALAIIGGESIGVTWDALDNFTDKKDFEIFTRVSGMSAISVFPEVQLLGRASFNAGVLQDAFTGLRTWYGVEQAQFIDGVETRNNYTEAGVTAMNPPSSITTNILMRVSGQNFSIKAWLPSETEPSTPQLSSTYGTAPSVSGFIGFLSHNHEIHEIGIGTGKLNAPRSAPTGPASIEEDVLAQYGATPLSVNIPIVVAETNYILIAAKIIGLNTITGVTDNEGGTYTQDAIDGADGNITIWRRNQAVGATAPTQVTFTFTGPNNEISARFFEITEEVSPSGTVWLNSTGFTNIATFSIDTTSIDSLVVGIVSSGTAGGPAVLVNEYNPIGGFTPISTETGKGAGFYADNLGAPGTKTIGFSWDLSGAGGYSYLAVNYVPVSGAAFAITDVTDGVDRTFTVGQTGIITTGSGFGSAP